MDHYAHLASHYDEYYRYSDNYINYFTGKIIEELSVKNSDTIVELGSGTGIFAKEILNKVPSIQMICVDNSALMLEINKDERIKQVCQDAVDFSKENISYDKVYMKEFLHHFHKEDRLILFKGLYGQLKSNGHLLILIELRRLNYPLFNEALKQFEGKQPSRFDIMKELELTGFLTSFKVISYPVNVTKTKYSEMVRNRYMSVLENFSDEELEKDIRSINEYQENDELEFFGNILQH